MANHRFQRNGNFYRPRSRGTNTFIGSRRISEYSCLTIFLFTVETFFEDISPFSVLPLEGLHTSIVNKVLLLSIYHRCIIHLIQITKPYRITKSFIAYKLVNGTLSASYWVKGSVP